MHGAVKCGEWRLPLTPTGKPFCWSAADQRRFYKHMIHLGDQRYDEHLGTLAPHNKERAHGKKT